MRRLVAALLAPLFSFQLIVPALFAPGDSNLPACCRRNGPHHCAMPDGGERSAASPSSTPAAAAHAQPCPYFPHGGAIIPHADASLTAGVAQPDMAAAAEYLAPVNTESGYAAAPGCSHHKRGPPVLS